MSANGTLPEALPSAGSATTARVASSCLTRSGRSSMFATAPDQTADVHSRLRRHELREDIAYVNLSFPLGRGTPVIRDANLNNVTSSNQSVTDATGLVVMASNDVTKRYWHADVTLQ
jgi:hypothetical protein